MSIQLPLNDVTKYLANNGWYKSSEIRDTFQIWHSHEFPESEVTLPLSEDHKRYDALLWDTIEELSAYLKVTHEALIKQISPLDFDAIMVRAIADDVQNGSIPFDDGIKLLSSSYQLLKHCSSKIQRFKNKNKHLGGFYNHIGMGQTQVGSYVVAIHSPLYRVNSDEEPNLFDSNSSLGRMINKLFYSKLAQVSSVFARESDIEVITQKLLELGIDKKDCDALIDIFGFKSHRDIEIKVNWSSKESIEEKYQSPISFYSRDAQKIVEYREVLKAKNTEKNIQLSGEVADLHRGYDDVLGRAKLRAKYQDREVSVSFTVSEDIYPIIARAHVAKKVVTLTGELEVLKVDNKISANFKSLSDWQVCENFEIEELDRVQESPNKAFKSDS
ncbi:hypothetical protein [Shewanella algae]|uniref:hypothetical protein n=1 Tax=Shewanella algae TaxID=38313 RepID=UPI001181D92E|nr:hypothetical protein [Shewanella algae]MBO2662799.1 hypothetical protein [Shewanella algae]MCL1053578.1 hypothetical protein [Shewanella algae]QGS59756.1 hypothetical protein GMX02_09670 [Shewanella algae]TVO88696.1 hypothetical protein AYI80_13670 [Shewanella algae]TXS85214.1 hypothetical protein AYI81_15710 [Shewanella algae]